MSRIAPTLVPTPPPADASAAAESPWPERRGAWRVVVILMIAYAISFVDRQVINLLTESIKRDLGISDLQIGMLQGLAFGIFYTLLGLPLGRLSDFYSRRNVVLAGALVWSLMTVSCGLARSFGQLFLTRVGVGVGEAALSPAAMSMISDYFPPERRAAALSLYVMGTSLGAGLALIVGGSVVGLVNTLGVVQLPLVGAVAPWQAAFIGVGLPSLLLLPLLATLREPARRGLLRVGAAAPAQLSLADGARYIWRRRAVYLNHHLGIAAVSVFTYGIAAWMPATFMRRFDWQPGEIGLVYGVMTITFGVGGVLAGGWIAGRVRRAGYRDANWRVMTLAVVLLVPFAVAMPLAPSAALVLVLMAPTTFLSTFPYGIAAAALQDVTPNQLRAQVTALYLLALGLLGLGIGPTAVGAFTDRVFGDPMQVGRSIALLCAIAGPIAIGCLVAGWKPYRELLEEGEA